MSAAVIHDAWRIGGYTVLEAIGATAYRATDGAREVALEISDVATDPRVTEVRHAAVARVLEARPFDDRYLVATEWIEGAPLAATPSLAWPQIRRIVTTIASGLGAIHEAGVVHGALELGNVLVTASGRPTIVGFGSEPAGVAPEQALGEPLDGRADFYALGVILYELLCGEPPLAGHQREPVIAPRKRAPERDIPKVAEDLCMWLLAKDRRARLPNARVFAVTIAATEVSP